MLIFVPNLYKLYDFLLKKSVLGASITRLLVPIIDICTFDLKFSNKLNGWFDL